MSKLLPAQDGKKYWRGIDELADTPEFRKHLEQEFPSSVEQIADPVSRRSFLTIMGAAVALSGVVGCSRPLAKILPYAKMPEDMLPGVPQQYASVFPFRGVGEGILVTSHEGRPTKIEGNPGHPSSLGATHGFAQASILDLYDPDRSQYPVHDDVQDSWETFAAWGTTRLREGSGRVRLLVEATPSPVVQSMRDAFAQAYPGATIHTYDPLNRDAVINGSRLAFGRPLRTQLKLDQADVVLSLDSDFMMTESNSVRNARDYARRRRVSSEKDSMNRLYMAESSFSVTGSMADHRLRLSNRKIVDLARALAGELGIRAGGQAPEGTATWISAVADDLRGSGGRAVILVGETMPAEVHALVHLMNQAIGAVGPVIRYTEEPYPGGQTDSISDLARAIDAGDVETLFILGGNPAYNAPADLDFAAKISKVAETAHLSSHRDETSALCNWHVPSTHYLEAWGDARAWDGTASIQQPLIAPLFDGKSELEVLAFLMADPRDGHQITHDYYATSWGMGASKARWDRALHDGVIAGTAFPEVVSTPQNGWLSGWRPSASGELEVVFRPDTSTWDGRFANNGWLQELPDSMSKLVWDNAALMSPHTASQLGAAHGDLVEVSVQGQSLTLAACIAPGLADETIQLPLGYGRTHAGRVGNEIGFNTYALRTSGGMGSAEATVAKASGTYTLVTTQEHHAMDGRPLVREASLEEYREEPNFATEAVHLPEMVSLYVDREYSHDEGEQWGMSIDLNTCIGCNACSIACTSENNIAIVGKDEVRRGREMAWIRIDRYYTGDMEEPEAVHQPVPCMQCENAPCESVCPVGATSHSKSGLNQMVYNRCIGTRYCNNNCPYKVRRFNYYAWRKEMTEVEKMAMNPDVTVRMRGVMEKCTYCVQRINRVGINAKNEGRAVNDGEIQTACQQSCPTGSIVFGNIADSNSEVSKRKAENRNYGILEELNTRPRTTYLAKIRNPNPRLEPHS